MKNRLLCITAIIGTCMLTACGGGTNSAQSTGAVTSENIAGESGDLYVNDGEYAGDDLQAEGEVPVQENAQVPTVEEAAIENNQKLIREINMSVETQEYDKLLKTIEEKVKSLGGYIESLNTGSNNYYSDSNSNAKSGTVTARIPASKLDSFVSNVAENSNVISREESVKDVTLEYVDLKSHRKSLDIEQERLFALLEKAESLDSIVMLESRLTEVRYEIESMESQLRTFDNQINYSTVYLTIAEVERITTVETREQTDWEKIKIGFSKNTYAIIHGLKNFMIRFIISLPILVVLAIFIILFIVVVKFSIHVNNKKKQQKIEKLMNQPNMVSKKEDEESK